MSGQNYNDIPTAFRSLRVLLVDRDASSLFNIAKEMEFFSYRVTTAELATLALSILQERKDSFDLVVTDINMHESECLEFIRSVQLIKDLPIILMSTEVDKDMIKEAMIKGACFFLRKPISSKNLKNLWQHVVRQNKYRTEQGADSEVAKVQEKNTAIERGSQEYGSEHVQIQKPTENRTKRSMSTDNGEQGDFKRRKTEIESSEKEKANSSSNSEKDHSNKLKSLVENEREREVRDNGTLENQLRVGQIHDVHLKLKGVIDADGKEEGRPGSDVLDITKELNLTQPQIFNHMQKYGVGTMETHFNKHELSGRSVDIYEEVDSSVDVDKIQVFPDSSQSLGTFLEEVGSPQRSKVFVKAHHNLMSQK